MGKFLGTSDPRVLLLISFGERVLAANPLHLFGAAGFSRWASAAAAWTLQHSMCGPMHVSTVLAWPAATLLSGFFPQ